MMRFIAMLFDAIALLGCIVGGWIAVTAMQAVSASQQDAGVAFGIAVAIIPYCLSGIIHRGALLDRIHKD